MVIAKIPLVFPEFITDWEGVLNYFRRNSSTKVSALSEGDKVEIKFRDSGSFLSVISGMDRKNNFGVVPADEVPSKIRKKLKRGQEVDITNDVRAEL